MSLYSLVIDFTTKKMGLFIGAASIFAFKVEIVLGRENTQIYGKTIIATFSLFAALFCAASSRDFEGHFLAKTCGVGPGGMDRYFWVKFRLPFDDG